MSRYRHWVNGGGPGATIFATTTVLDFVPALASPAFRQRSFRSRVIESGRRFRIVVRYIHRNPVKRGLCEQAADWRWSSAWMWEQSEVDDEQGIRLGCWWESRSKPPAQQAAGGMDADALNRRTC